MPSLAGMDTARVDLSLAYRYALTRDWTLAARATARKSSSRTAPRTDRTTDPVDRHRAPVLVPSLITYGPLITMGLITIGPDHDSLNATTWRTRLFRKTGSPEPDLFPDFTLPQRPNYCFRRPTGSTVIRRRCFSDCSAFSGNF
jgi:hypothetical protein